ncbi:MAG: metallophosphoesterase [Thermoplasmata archaeon]
MEEIDLGDFIITKYYSLYLKKSKTMVMADLHIGFEDVMAEKGLFLPKVQKSILLDIFERLFSYYEIKNFLIDGDFKHEFSRNMKQEWNEIEYIINYLKERCNIIIIRGNHDNYLKAILAKYDIKLHEKIMIDNYLFLHGHKEYEGNEKIIIGHEHPSVKIRESYGGLINYPSFLIGKDIVVLPSPSIYSSGSDILAGDILSPILKNRLKGDEDIYGIDSKLGIIYFGKYNHLRSRIFL